MKQTYSALNKQVNNADNMRSVVKTMKSLAAVTISQFEEAALALQDYSTTVERALVGYFTGPRIKEATEKKHHGALPRSQRIAIIFGTDLGMIGTYNDRLAQYTLEKYEESSDSAIFRHNQIKFWVIGERMVESIENHGYLASKIYPAPDSRSSLKRLITEIVEDLRVSEQSQPASEVILFHNEVLRGITYRSCSKSLLPLDQVWLKELQSTPWESRVVPDVIYDDPYTLTALLKEYLFVSLFRSCALSIVAENGARLAYMEQAEKKIDEMIDQLKNELRRARQNKINNELFDIIAGYEALSQELEGELEQCKQ